MTLPDAHHNLPQLAGHLDDLRGQLDLVSPEKPGELSSLRLSVEELQCEVEGWPCGSIISALGRLVLLTEVWECLVAQDPAASTEVGDFFRRVLEQLAQNAREGDGTEDVEWVMQESTDRWGSYLRLLGSGEPEAPIEEDPPPIEETGADDAPSMDFNSLLRLLTNDQANEEPNKRVTPPGLDALVSSFDCVAGGGEAKTQGPSNGSAAPVWGPADVGPSEPANSSLAFRGFDPNGGFENESESPTTLFAPLLEQEPELREAFLADATDLFERIQTLVLDDLGRAGSQTKAVRELCRCFHTLKGASGSVGLTELADRIHHLEDRLEAAASDTSAVPIDALHETLTYLEHVLDILQKDWRSLPITGGAGSQPQPVQPVNEFPPPTPMKSEPEAISGWPGSGAAAHANEGWIRVSCERIDELMDLVSELITRRGLWASQAETMKEFAATARLGRNRLMASIDRLRDLPVSRDTGPVESMEADGPGMVVRLVEQAEDLAALAETARAAADPVADDADALARVSLRLWDALQAVRVVSVRGLFHRLARVAREAARVEGHPIEIVTIGEDAGLDRSVQDKAFEPLLHAVRNAVSHGIEPVHERVRVGKPPLGRVTLEARREGYTLVLKVEDDGRGLNYAAIEEKGRRLGLLQPGEEPTPERLNALVFQPGFSTRSEANKIAGRGVGMDVITQEVARLHGAVTLASDPGKGTTLTIRLPARLALEQAMVMRVEGRPFALPLASIEQTQQLVPTDLEGKGAGATVRLRDGRVRLLDARRVLGLPAASPLARPKLLVVRSEGESLALLVDAIDGPRELVIKPIGPLLTGHPVIAGTSLSTAGELILVLDPFGLVHHNLAAADAARPAVREAKPSRPATVLVVDDAISVRRAARRHLSALGLETDEAGDGVEALRKVRSGSYRLLLVDLEIPRMDGFELLAELGRSGMSTATPVVVITTRSDPKTLRRVLDLGAKALLAKPIGQKDLASVILPLLQLSDPSEQTIVSPLIGSAL